MARKNNSRSENSGSITFDTRTKAVMAEVSLAQDKIKEKVNAVREVILGKSNNEIVLVLQYYDYNVEKTIQAYCDDGAKAALNAWNFPGNKAQTKKKKNRKKSAQKSIDSVATPNGDVSSSMKENIPNGITENGSTSSKLTESDTEPGAVLNGHASPSASSLSPSSVMFEKSLEHQISQLALESSTKPETQSESTLQPKQSQPVVTATYHSQPQRQPHHQRQRTHSGSQSQRMRTNSERSTASGHGDHKTPIHYRVHAGLEKSVKDLHRQTVSLERLRLVLNEEVEKTYKRIKAVFEEMRTCLNSREEALLSEMDQVKLAAHDIYAMRQKTAGELKVKVDRSEGMNDQELAELRSEIKHFVSERKVDEDLGRTTRFLYDSDHLKEEIAQFAEVVPVKCMYSKRRPSVSSVASSGVGDESESLSSSLNGYRPTVSVSVPSGQVTLDATETHEVAELQKRLQGQLQLQGFTKKGSNNRSKSASSPSKENSKQSYTGKSTSHSSLNQEGSSNRGETSTLVNTENSSRPGSASGRTFYGRGGRGRGRGGDRGRGGGERGRGSYRGRGDGRPRSPRKDGYYKDSAPSGGRNTNHRPPAKDSGRENPPKVAE